MVMGTSRESLKLSKPHQATANSNTTYTSKQALMSKRHIGEGFIAKNITFINSAGAGNGQAVAVKSSSMFSAFYQCRFKGYQDTLYVHSGIQFYRECEIFGTVDFIFGDARVVFQKCGMYVRLPGNTNVITAQGRGTSLDSGGISIHNCTIAATKEFNSHLGIKAYLGRPWGRFSKVVIMQSFLDDIIDPEGWLQWGNDTSSLYYGEYNNTGVGASLAKRVKWKGRKRMDLVQAKKFTVRNFIYGQKWLNPTKIPYSLDFM
ncbi:unnamed protein product [Ilex paraguariensis]|uniref:Pectinesterase n=1 Tax=Ilex paraguariensis TaxID=185542 RepID=A0ABC8S189_9AQUA